MQRVKTRALIEGDLYVGGGISDGVTEAVQAERIGKTVVVARMGKHPGGMTNGKLSAVNIGDLRNAGNSEGACPTPNLEHVLRN